MRKARSKTLHVTQTEFNRRSVDSAPKPCQRKASLITEQGTNALTSMCSYATGDVTVLSDNNVM